MAMFEPVGALVGSNFRSGSSYSRGYSRGARVSLSSLAQSRRPGTVFSITEGAELISRNQKGIGANEMHLTPNFNNELFPTPNFNADQSSPALLLWRQTGEQGPMVKALEADSPSLLEDLIGSIKAPAEWASEHHHYLAEVRKAQTERYPLRGSVLRYDDPTAPVAENEWDVLR